MQSWACASVGWQKDKKFHFHIPQLSFVLEKRFFDARGKYRWVMSELGGHRHPPPDFDKSVNPISTEWADYSRVFLLCQLWIVNYFLKSYSNSLSNENINIGVSVVIKTKCLLKCQNRLISLETPVFTFTLLRIFDKLLSY